MFILNAWQKIWGYEKVKNIEIDCMLLSCRACVSEWIYNL